MSAVPTSNGNKNVQPADITTEWIKGLLAVPFVLYSQPQGVFEGQGIHGSPQTRDEAHRRYSEILRDVEIMIDDHSTCFCISISATQ